MKRIAIVIFAALLFVFCFGNASLYAIRIADYTFTNDHYSIDCAMPFPAPVKTFDARYDDEMCIMLYLENVSPGDTLYFKWYYEGVQVSTSDTITYADSVVHCPFNCTDIRNTDIKYVTGNITIEAYLNGSFNLSDGFYLIGLSSTTTSIRPTTTSSVSGGVTIDSHTMTLDPKMNSGCELPSPNYTFYDYHEAAHCWVLFSGVTPQDDISVQWYSPNGNLYSETRLQDYPGESFCWFPSICISGCDAESLPGNWRVCINYDGSRFCEYFEIVSTKPTTTSSSSTTTTSYSPNPCMMSLVYGDPSEETDLLRYYRDNVLRQTPEGRELIKLYYLWSPVIVKAMEQDEEFKGEIKQMIDGVLPMLENAVD